MTFYLASSIISGRLSNEVPGLVTGTLRLAGLRHPVSVELRGNFLRDIAGGQIEFANPIPQANADFVSRLLDYQRGEVGEMTASRRIKHMLRQARPPQIYPAQAPQGALKNLLFLEWFNQQGQRIVIQSWHWHVQVSAPQWLLTKELESHLIRESRARRKAFLLEERSSQPDDAAPPDGNPVRPSTLRDLLTEHTQSATGAADKETLVELAGGLRTELKRLETLLRRLQTDGVRHTLAGLLQSLADLSAQLAQTMGQFTTLPREGWSFLVMDVEQATLLLNAAKNVCDDALQENQTVSDYANLSDVHKQIQRVQRKIAEFLEALKK